MFSYFLVYELHDLNVSPIGWFDAGDDKGSPFFLGGLATVFGYERSSLSA